MRRVAILGCGGRKQEIDHPVPAIDLYTRGWFAVAHSTLRSIPPNQHPEFWILSALHGLIPGSRFIRPYDLRMTKERAIELGDQIEDAKEILLRREIDDLMIVAGSVYREALHDVITDDRIREIEIPDGAIGLKNRALKAWILKGAQ